MKKRIRNKQIAHFSKNCNVWYNPSNDAQILVPKSGKIWYLFCKACEQSGLSDIVTDMVEQYNEAFEIPAE